MKPIAVLSALVIALFLLPAAAFAQQARVSDTLSPEDLGIEKYVFETTPPKGSVAVFRMEEYIDGVLLFRREVISGCPGVKRSEKVLLVDWGSIRGNTDGASLITGMWRINLPPGAFMEGSRFQTKKEPEFKINFLVRENGRQTERTFIFDIRNESYTDAKRRIPGLCPQFPAGWVFAYASDAPHPPAQPEKH